MLATGNSRGGWRGDTHVATLSTLAEPLACLPLEAAEAGGEAMLPPVEEEEVPVEEVVWEEVLED